MEAQEHPPAEPLRYVCLPVPAYLLIIAAIALAPVPAPPPPAAPPVRSRLAAPSVFVSSIDGLPAAPPVHGPLVAPPVRVPPGLSTALIALARTTTLVPATTQAPPQNHEELPVTRRSTVLFGTERAR